MKVALLHFCFVDYTIELANSLAQYVNLTLIHPEKVSTVCLSALNLSIQVKTFSKPRIRYPHNLMAMAKMMQIIREIQRCCASRLDCQTIERSPTPATISDSGASSLSTRLKLVKYCR
jgi:hypothetical protein